MALKGFCTSAADKYQNIKLNSLAVDWFYTWGMDPNLGTPVNDFTPMIWSKKNATAAMIAEIDANHWKYQNTYLLGFNEPDHTSQANMTVDEAINLWPVLEQSRAKLVSPATTHPRAAWMTEFMQKATERDLRIDAVAIHLYQGASATGYLAKMDEAWEKWGKNIWVTEACVADWNATATNPSQYTRAEVNDCMRGIWEGLATRPYVTRFSWKTRDFTDPVMGSGALFDSQGNRTSTGHLYTSLLSH